jgi:hypothetical protein
MMADAKAKRRGGLFVVALLSDSLDGSPIFFNFDGRRRETIRRKSPMHRSTRPVFQNTPKSAELKNTLKSRLGLTPNPTGKNIPPMIRRSNPTTLNHWLRLIL